MFQQSGARYLVPIHWGTFRLSKEPMDEPLRRLIAARRSLGRIVSAPDWRFVDAARGSAGREHRPAGSSRR